MILLKRQFQDIYDFHYSIIPELSSRTSVDMALVTESAATRRSLRRLLPLLFVPAAELLPEPAREEDDVPRIKILNLIVMNGKGTFHLFSRLILHIVIKSFEYLQYFLCEFLYKLCCHFCFAVHFSLIM